MSINSLIPDIYQQVQKKDGWFTPELASLFGQDVALRVAEKFSEPSPRPTLRLSQMGPKCPSALWYSIHRPEEAEAMPPWAEVKFSYGHILEALALAFARAAGHKVEGEQDVVILDGVVGHRDAVIDGCIVDVKSASSRSFAKFKDGSIRQDDSFGYLDQLDGYVVGSREDPLVTVKDRGYILAIDKTLGHMCLYEHTVRKVHIRRRIIDYRRIISSEQAPACTCGTVADGKSGNIRLDTKASYSMYKHACFPSLRTFIYASGPVYLTHVARKPDVLEVDRYGKPVYN